MNETVADIVKKKREQADEIERYVAAKMKSGETVLDQYARELIADIRRDADRLEAALKRTMEKEFAKVKEIADEMRRFGERHWMHDAGHNVRMFADQIDKAILFRKWR